MTEVVELSLFLQPARGVDGLAERLSDLASEDIDVTHFALSDFAPTPLAISIETKSLQAKPIERLVLERLVRLANWVRARFRQLATVVKRPWPRPALRAPYSSHHLCLRQYVEGGLCAPLR
jgi:hypothetical protein